MAVSTTRPARSGRLSDGHDRPPDPAGVSPRLQAGAEQNTLSMRTGRGPLMSTLIPEVRRPPTPSEAGYESPLDRSPSVPTETLSGPAGAPKTGRCPDLFLVAVWLVSAMVLGALLMWSAHTSGPLDDPDLAAQRAGMLDVVGGRTIAPMIAVGVPAEGKAGVVFFVRPAQLADLQAVLADRDGSKLAASANVSVVVSAIPNERGQLAGGAPVFGDPKGLVAAGYGMRRPRDGGPPVGYAVVGPDRTVRFRTEDPGMSGRLTEVLTMVKALP